MAAEHMPLRVIREYDESQAGERVGWVHGVVESKDTVCVQGVIATVGLGGAQVTCEQYRAPGSDHALPYDFRASGFDNAIRLLTHIQRDRVLFSLDQDNNIGIAPPAGGTIAPDALVALADQELIIDDGFGVATPTDTPAAFMRALRSTLDTYDAGAAYQELYYWLNDAASTFISRPAFFATKTSEWALPDPDMYKITAVKQSQLEHNVYQIDGLIAHEAKANAARAEGRPTAFAEPLSADDLIHFKSMADELRWGTAVLMLLNEAERGVA